MDFELTARCEEMRAELLAFMDEYIYPNEKTYDEQLDTQGTRWQTPQIMDDLKVKARERGLWNLFLPDAHHGAGLKNAEYAPLCEIMGRVDWAPEVFNCNAPDTGNMEVLHMYGTPAQQDAWLKPLLNGEIRSAFAMTEPDVASSD
ncbi:MAG: acyl-CoA dehydrogenase family protein, partial [Alphaproteobacteria bacterium]